jgi:type I restriction enzyme S subunit
MSSHVSVARECLIGERRNADIKTVSELVSESKIFVEDGNHGENRPRQDEFCEKDGGIPFLRPPDLKDGRVDFKNCDFINEQGFARVRKGIGKPGDVILTHRATVGRIAITRDDAPSVFVTNPGTTIWRSLDKDLLNQRYLYFYMSSKIFQDRLFSEVGHTSTFDYVSLTQQRTLPVVIPEIRLQRHIAHILGTLDDKIELNRKTNETLEAMAKALFKSWFVDFDPVRAKAEGRPTGLPAEISDLFPDSFEDSELGEIPSGWRIAPVGEVVECVGGSTPSTNEPDYWDGGEYFWATPKDLSSLSEPFLLDTAKKITADGVQRISSGILPVGTVLLSSRAPVGYVAAACVPVSINQGFIALKCNDLMTSVYLLNWCLSNVQQFKDRASGTTFAEISKAAFRPIPILVPSEQVARSFAGKAQTLYERVVSNMRQSTLLATTRDSLLPKLISGEIRIPDAERMLEEVGV